MSTEATVLFCVGATKAGTSWFHQYLENHPDCHMRGIKELHYFDALDLGSGAWNAKRIETNRRALIERLKAGQTERPMALKHRIGAHGDLLDLHLGETEDPQAYLRYMNKGRGERKLVADVTPAYGLLSPERFARMATIAENVRFLYILRDPVSRLWSHIRMLAGRAAETPNRLQELAAQTFWKFGDGVFPAVSERGDYAKTLSNLDKVLGPGQLFTVFYEELFNAKTLGRICEFLGIGDSAAQLTNVVHAGPDARMDSEMLDHARKWLAPQYEFVQKRSGYLPPQWQVNALGAQASGAQMLGVDR